MVSVQIYGYLKRSLILQTLELVPDTLTGRDLTVNASGATGLFSLKPAGFSEVDESRSAPPAV